MKNKCLKVLTLLMAVILVLTVGTSNVAKAENQSLAEYGYEIEDNMIPFNFKKENLQVPEGWTYGTQSNPLIPKEFGENYDFYYPESLNYFGEWLNVNVNVEYYGTNDYQNYMDADNNWSGIWAGSGGDHPNSVCLRTFGTDYKITITFTDKNGDPFKFTGATLFVDPDESNYLEFTSDEIYYVNVGNNQFKHSGIDLPNNTLPANTLMLADYYEYDPTFGLLRKDSEYDKADTWVPFDNGSFGVLIKESSEFTYIINGKDDWIYLPDFFIVYVPYNIEYYYMLDDGTYPETPDYPTEDEDKYSEPYRRGPVYILEENEKGILDVKNPLPSVSVEDDDLIPNPEKSVADETGRIRNYALDESMDDAWELQVQADGSTTLKVYFKQTYKVTYHDNGNLYGWTPEDAFANQSRDDYEYNEGTDMFDGVPTKKGYEFIGWSATEEKTTDVLTSEEVAAILVTQNADYWAQWKKIKKDDPTPTPTPTPNPGVYVVPNTATK